jgi:hypothetical protein
VAPRTPGEPVRAYWAGEAPSCNRTKFRHGDDFSCAHFHLPFKLAMDIVLTAQTKRAFRGFKRDMLFNLTNGTHWLQAEYKYWYHYAYRPQVEIVRDGGGLYLRLAGRDEAVLVRQLSRVFEGQLADAFEGWLGESEYELTNGQVWRQRAYKYEYKYVYRPHVVIYPGPSGTVMDVEGSRAVVERVR